MTVEELKSMTQEDLVKRVQELQEANENLAKEKDSVWDYYSKSQEKYRNLKNAVRSIVLVID